MALRFIAMSMFALGVLVPASGHADEIHLSGGLGVAQGSLIDGTSAPGAFTLDLTLFKGLGLYAGYTRAVDLSISGLSGCLVGGAVELFSDCADGGVPVTQTNHRRESLLHLHAGYRWDQSGERWARVFARFSAGVTWYTTNEGSSDIRAVETGESFPAPRSDVDRVLMPSARVGLGVLFGPPGGRYAIGPALHSNVGLAVGNDFVAGVSAHHLLLEASVRLD